MDNYNIFLFPRDGLFLTEITHHEEIKKQQRRQKLYMCTENNLHEIMSMLNKNQET